MDDTTLTVIVLGLALVLIGALVIVLMRMEKRAAAGRVALAERRLLMFRETPATRGRAGKYVFEDNARGMVLEITRPRNTKSSKSPGQTVLRLSQPRLQDGLAVWAQGMPAGMGAQMAQFGGLMELGLVQMLLRKVLGDEIAPHLADLRDVPLPEGAGVLLLASVDPALLPASAPIAAALSALPRNSGAQSLAMLGTGGLTLRMTRAVTDPAGIEAVLDAGLQLREAMR